MAPSQAYPRFLYYRSVQKAGGNEAKGGLTKFSRMAMGVRARSQTYWI